MSSNRPASSRPPAAPVAATIPRGPSPSVDDLLTRGAGDDDSDERDTGAGMMGVQEFNSACFYRYLLIDREQLVHNLNGDAATANAAALTPGRPLRFRLRANPIVNEPQREEGAQRSTRGKRRGVVGEEQQTEWLAARLAASGAELVTVTTVDEGVWRDHREHGRQFQSAHFDGLLRVTDPNALLQAVRDGLGAGKGFGFGLLSLAPA